jgi:hypothetical protein
MQLAGRQRAWEPKGVEMSRVFAISSLAAAAIALFLVSGAGANPAPTQLAQYDLIFSSASDTFTFGVEKLDGNGAGDLSVDTIDCCIPGDLWTVALDTAQPANPAHDVTSTGNGSISAFSGSATSHPFIRGSVTVSYSGGTDVFPAEMCVRFQYSKAPGVEITPPAGAVLNGGACPTS